MLRHFLCSLATACFAACTYLVTAESQLQCSCITGLEQITINCDDETTISMLEAFLQANNGYCQQQCNFIKHGIFWYNLILFVNLSPFHINYFLNIHQFGFSQNITYTFKSNC